MHDNQTYLVLGGARSGKSRYAEQLAQQLADASNGELVYLATATAKDDEMQTRIDAHQQQRAKANWLTVEEPLALADALKQQAGEGRVIVVDCLTMWLMNLLMLDDKARLDDEIDQLLSTINHLSGELILVSNEVGLGIIPLGELTRKYVDCAGLLHQQLAEKMDHVVMIMAGLPHVLKQTETNETKPAGRNK